MRTVLRSDSVEILHESAAAFFVAAARDAIDERGAFMVALAGGSTPKAVYSMLATNSHWRSQVPWQQVHFFWGDERHVPPDHQESNFRMAREAMLDRLPIDRAKVWRIKGEYPDAREAAAEYETRLRAAFATEVPRFDLVLLGMGPDGHTASLFPGTDALHEQQRLAVANRVPQLATERITLTFKTLNHAAEVLFLVHGDDKADALKAVLEGPTRPDEFPAQMIQPSEGRLRWLIDRTAARLLSEGVTEFGTHRS
jgi:6-phosphogluconolactonase